MMCLLPPSLLQQTTSQKKKKRKKNRLKKVGKIQPAAQGDLVHYGKDLWQELEVTHHTAGT